MSGAELTALLIAAQRTGTRPVDAAAFSDLDREAAYAVQRDVLMALGEKPGVIKTAVHGDGAGVAAPIYAGHVGRDDSVRLPFGLIAGVEVEVGVVLGRDVGSARDLPAAIDHYFVGIEVCGTRYVDRSAASPAVGLADNMSAFGYIIGPARAANDAIDGLDVQIEVASQLIYRAPAKHGFGTVLASLLAYADNQVAHLPLTAGTVVTTGSMCGLVPVPGVGRCVARLGDQAVSFEIVD